MTKQQVKITKKIKILMSYIKLSGRRYIYVFDGTSRHDTEK